MKKLILCFNQLSSLPPEIGNLQNLWDLNLARNKLSTLPIEIKNLQNLIALDLCGNQFSRLPIDILKQMPNLKYLVLMNKYGKNPLKEEEVKALHEAMPWCEIIWDEKVQ